MYDTGFSHKTSVPFYRLALRFTIAIISIFAISFSIYFMLEGLADKIWIVLSGCGACFLVIIIFSRGRGILDQALTVPLLIYIIFTAGSIMSGRISTFFTINFCICCMAMMYFSFWKFLQYAVISNGITLILILSGVLTDLSINYTFTELIINWMYLAIASMFMLSVIKFVSEIIKRSTKAEDSFTTMLSSTPDYIVLVNELNCITYISKTLAEFAHIENPEMALGRPLMDIFREMDLKLKSAEVLDSQGLYEGTWELSLNGEKRYLRIISNKLLGDTTGLFINLSDITPLVKARFDAEAADRAKSTFLTNTSHEIRTPMNAILGMSELILRKDIPQDIYDDVMNIKQAGTNLLAIVNDVLDFSKIESGKLEIIPVEYKLDSMLNDVITIVKTRLIEKPFDFITKIDGSLPSVLIGDAFRVRQVLVNLLSNAVKYTKKGNICFSVFSTQQNRSSPEDNATDNSITLTFEVADTGIGIQQEKLSRLFIEFEQLDARANLGLEGTGLGLVISRNLCRLMNGDVTVHSVYGEGSVFSAVIPQGVNDYAPMAKVSESKSRAVLICEDDKKRLEALIYTVKQLGVSCTPVSSQTELELMLMTNRYGYALVSCSMYDKVQAVLGSSEKKLALAVLPDLHERVFSSAFRILSMPLLPVSLADFFNDISQTGAKNMSVIFTVNFIVPEARFLVVDDFPTNLKVTKGLLSPYHATVDTCLSGAASIEMVKQHEYDIIFMDHMMPEMDGIEATKSIRIWEAEQKRAGKLPEDHRPVPIIALTANAVSGMKEMFMENGFNDFLSKPIDTVKLDEMIINWVPENKRQALHKELQSVPVSKSTAVDNLQISFPDIPGVDIKQGLAMTGGAIGVYRQVLALFRKDAEKQLPLLGAFLENANAGEADKGAETNLSAFTIQVHALKSALHAMGAPRLSSEAALLEKAGATGNIPYIREELSGFIAGLEKLSSGIAAALDTAGEKTESPALSFNADSLPLLPELRDALTAQDTININLILNKLNQQNTDPEIRKILEEIYDQVLMSEFEGAVKIIDSLLKG